jgi:hypothetical protein
VSRARAEAPRDAEGAGSEFNILRVEERVNFNVATNNVRLQGSLGLP